MPLSELDNLLGSHYDTGDHLIVGSTPYTSTTWTNTTGKDVVITRIRVKLYKVATPDTSSSLRHRFRKSSISNRRWDFDDVTTDTEGEFYEFIYDRTEKTRVVKKTDEDMSIEVYQLPSDDGEVYWVGLSYEIYGYELSRPAAGNGSELSPYLITDMHQLKDIHYFCILEDLDLEDAHFELFNDINCLGCEHWYEGRGWEPIGQLWEFFHGFLDGKGHTIYHLVCNRGEDPTFKYHWHHCNEAGLFGFMYGNWYKQWYEGETRGLCNINIHQPVVHGPSGNGTGALIGGIAWSVIRNVHVTGAQMSSWYLIGGVVGNPSSDVLVENCSATGLDLDMAEEIDYSFNRWGWALGGVVGCIAENSVRSKIVNCHAEGSISADWYMPDLSECADVGGVCGNVYKNDRIVEIENCWADMQISGPIYRGGGVVGYLDGDMKNCYPLGNIHGSEQIGGLIGTVVGGEIHECYIGQGKVEASPHDWMNGNQVGGFVGIVENGSIENCYSRANVEGNDDVGGFVGKNQATIKNCYSTGESNDGGFCGHNDGGSIIACFWDTVISGQSTSDGGEGKTTAEMQSIHTFEGVGWDIRASEEKMNDGYPFLSWQLGSSPVWLMLPGAPKVETVEAKLILRYNAFLKGQLTNTGGMPCTVGFRYGPSLHNITEEVIAGVLYEPSEFGFFLSNLAPGTTYYFKAFAYNDIGEDEGEVIMFFTHGSLSPIPGPEVPGPYPGIPGPLPPFIPGLPERPDRMAIDFTRIGLAIGGLSGLIFILTRRRKREEEERKLQERKRHE